MTSENRSYDEKRDFIRMKVDTPADIVISNDSQKIHGVCRDLSGGGMQIELPVALPVGTLTEVSISSPHGHEPMLHAEAKVTRIATAPNRQPSVYLIGLQINKIISE